MRLFNARVKHFDKYIRVLREVYHQLLPFLHMSERIKVDSVRIVEKQVVFACQFDADLLNLCILLPAEHHHLAADRFERSNFLRSVLCRLQAQLKGCFAVKQYRRSIS